MRAAFLSALSFLPLVTSAACSGEDAKSATGAVVSKAVEVSKGAASGILDGMEEGRKGAPSADGAVVVTKWSELVAHGGASVVGKAAAEGNDKETVVELAVENRGEAPLRVSGAEVIGLDQDGFAIKPTSGLVSETVPPKAKVKVSVRLPVEAKKLAKVRLWEHELVVP